MRSWSFFLTGAFNKASLKLVGSILFGFMALATIPEYASAVETTDVNAQDGRGYTALMQAVEAGDEKSVRSLLKQGADVNIRPFWQGYFQSKAYSILEMVPGDKKESLGTLLLQAGANVDEVLPNGDTLLLHAIENYDGVMLAWLLEHGADANRPGKGGDTPLIRVVRHGQVEMYLKPLIAHGADVHLRNGAGESPLGMAEARLAEGNMYLAMMFRELGVKVKVSPDQLLRYGLSKNEKLVYEALAMGANPNLVWEPDGTSILLMALMAGKKSEKLAKTLILKGADVDFVGSPKAKPYISALTMALQMGIDDEVVKMIVDRTKEINRILLVSRMDIGYTALDMAVAVDNEEIVRYIKKAGGVSAKPELPKRTLATNAELAKEQARAFLDQTATKQCKQAWRMTKGGLWHQRYRLSSQEWMQACPSFAEHAGNMDITEVYYPKDSTMLMRSINMGMYDTLNLEKAILVSTHGNPPSQARDWTLVLSCTASRCAVAGLEERLMKNRGPAASGMAMPTIGAGGVYPFCPNPFAPDKSCWPVKKEARTP